MTVLPVLKKIKPYPDVFRKAAINAFFFMQAFGDPARVLSA